MPFYDDLKNLWIEGVRIQCISSIWIQRYTMIKWYKIILLQYATGFQFCKQRIYWTGNKQSATLEIDLQNKGFFIFLHRSSLFLI